MKRIAAIFLSLAVCLSLLPGAAAAVQLPFRDVPGNAWYYDAVSSTHQSGLLAGRAGDTYAPHGELTCGEILVLADAIRSRSGDTASSASGKSYDRDAAATRALCAEILADSLSDETLAPINTVPDDAIPDVPMDHPQAPAIYKLYRAGILAGRDEDHSFCPDDPVSRCEAAVMARNLTQPDCRALFQMNAMSGLPEEDEPLSGAPGSLTVTSQPQSTQGTGGMFTFRVTVSGGKTPYTYRWQYRTDTLDWSTSYDSTTHTLNKFPSASMVSSGLRYRCVITDAAGAQVTTQEAWALAPGQSAPEQGGGTSSTPSQPGAPLTITQDLHDIVLAPGEPLVLQVAVSGGVPPYQCLWDTKTNATVWYRLYDNPSTTMIRYPTASMLASGLEFRCNIYDSTYTMVTSSSMRVIPANQISSLSIASHPKDTAAAVGDKAVFTVEAAGGRQPYTYRWEYELYEGEWAVLFDSTSNTLTRYPDAAMLDENAAVRCVVFDAEGISVVSNPARFIPKPATGNPLTIVDQPRDIWVELMPSGYVTFNVSATGGKAPYTYRWQSKSAYSDGFYDLDETDIDWAPGYMTNSLCIPFTMEALDDNLLLRCVVTDSTGKSVISRAARFEGAWIGPVFLEHPKGVVLDQDDLQNRMAFHVKLANGTQPYTYRWQYLHDGITEPREFSSDDSWAWDHDTNLLRVSTAAPYSGLKYRCVVTDAEGAIATSRWSEPVTAAD